MVGAQQMNIKRSTFNVQLSRGEGIVGTRCARSFSRGEEGPQNMKTTKRTGFKTADFSADVIGHQGFVKKGRILPIRFVFHELKTTRRQSGAATPREERRLKRSCTCL